MCKSGFEPANVARPKRRCVVFEGAFQHGVAGLLWERWNVASQEITHRVVVLGICEASHAAKSVNAPAKASCRHVLSVPQRPIRDHYCDRSSLFASPQGLTSVVKMTAKPGFFTRLGQK